MTSLQQVVRRVGPLDYRRAARYIDEVSQQLSSLHAAGSLHGDVRPAMLTLDEQGRARLGPRDAQEDADVAFVSSSKTDSQSVFEIADYLAPEQALNSPKADARADIYSLGCTFYFLLTGHPPYPGGSISERLLKHQVEPVTDLTNARPGTPTALANLCRQMMSKKPTQRPQTTEEVSSILTLWLASQDAD
jgi:serine/threonine-protein kinase